MDALSDVLRAVRLTGAIFFDVQASEPWVAETPRGPIDRRHDLPRRRAPHPLPRRSRRALLGLGPRTNRRCTFRPATSSCFRTATRTRCRARPACAARRTWRSIGAQATASCRSRSRWAHTRSDPAHLVCGFLGCDARPFNPLLAALPRVIRVSDRAGGAIGAFVQFAIAESKERRLGGEVRARAA